MYRRIIVPHQAEANRLAERYKALDPADNALKAATMHRVVLLVHGEAGVRDRQSINARIGQVSGTVTDKDF